MPLTVNEKEQRANNHGMPYFPSSTLLAPHVGSFDFFYDHGLSESVKLIKPVKIDGFPEKNIPGVRIWIDSAVIKKPMRQYLTEDTRLLPNECREMHVDYSGEMHLTLKYQIKGSSAAPGVIERKVGTIPLMVKSSACHLKHMEPKQLIAAKEEATELGGYFILNGNEKIIRMLIVPRRNQLVGMVRTSWRSRGKLYTEFGVMVRSGRSDMTTQSCTLHYLSNGSCNLRISVNKQEMFIPAIILLRCFRNSTDKYVFEQLVAGEGGDKNRAAIMASRGESVLRGGSHLGFRSQSDNLAYLGKNFRAALRAPASECDELVGKRLLQEYVLVHCEYSQLDNSFIKPKESTTNQNKFNTLVLMMKKLYNLVDGRIRPDNPDALDSHELLLPGHLYTMIVKEQMTRYLGGVQSLIAKSIRNTPNKVDFTSEAFWTRICNYQIDIGRKVRYFMSTGNLVSQTGLDLMQTTGFTIMADKLNYMRWMSHFRSIHRGQFFTTMKTTTVRKLLPEQWGYVCPVHTPDGGPCGLLNHIAALCLPITHKPLFSRAKLIALLTSIGMSDLEAADDTVPLLPVQLDGVLIGRVPSTLAKSFVNELRFFKVVENGDPRLENTRADWVVPPSMEIDAVLDYSDKCFPGIRLYIDAGRMVRPVRYLLPEALRGRPSLASEYMEMIGPCEQTNMEIAVAEDDFRMGETTHVEYAPEAILSMIAAMTPFSDFNQSPRNMYQCQMGKQTMGTPCHTFQHRTDNKMYRIQNPQRPLVYNDAYDEYAMNEYPMGTNSIVAVISYTGYDMEDACIINKSSYERGFMHASVYKTVHVDLHDLKKTSGEPISNFFRRPAEDAGADDEYAALDADGLPFVGDRKNKGDVLYNVHNNISEQDSATVYKYAESCAIDEIRLNGGAQSRKQAHLQKVSFKYRLNRNPVIGDKFASRHGQKGVLSMLWPQEDMPFTEHGVSPDLIINPHAFPSRMTIGMLIESLAGKSAALHGIEQNSTPFQYRHTGESEVDSGPVEYFGEQLAAAGFNYAGTEPLYSGVTGEEMKAEIYIGVIYYQRLRHMVKDKFQVRATGPVNRIHRQPVKGRKVGGGIRFGEMERDSMLGHGTAFLLHDRLMACSDYHVNYVCKQCGSALSASQTHTYVAGSTQMPQGERVLCRTCQTGSGVVPVALPFVFMYLINELAAMGIRLTLDVA